MMVVRRRLSAAVRDALRHNPIVVLLGPRQCGKTTLSRHVMARRKAHFLDLEDPVGRARLETPKMALEGLRGVVVLDEIQRKPELFEVLRVLADRPGTPARFLLLGSASPHVIRGVSESLAGRAAFVKMEGFDLHEIGAGNFDRLWLRGGLPRSYLAADDVHSLSWRGDFVTTFLERDVPQFGFSIPPETLRRFWTMVAHFHGQVFNAAEFARSLGSSEGTARRYLDLLSGAFVVRQLEPWFENIAKRQVKSPKVYIRDSGILHALLHIPDRVSLSGHPKYGASWEGFALEQVLSILKPADAYFWASHAGAEIDLLVFHGGKRLGFEFKCSDAPPATPSMKIALEDLKLDRVFTVYPGAQSYPLGERLEALAIRDLVKREFP